MRALARLLVLALLAAGCAEEKPVVRPPAAGPASATQPAPASSLPAPAAKDRPVKKRLPPPALTPQVTGDEEQRLMREARTRIARVEERVAGLDAASLAEPDRELLGTIRTFLSRARVALAEKDFPRALNLAEKAGVLAGELPGGAP